MKSSEQLKIIAILKAAYPSWKATADTTALWSEMIADLSYAATDGALRRIIMLEDLQFPPSIARIRKEVAKLGQPDLALSAEEAWGKVLAAVGTNGRNREPDWEGKPIGAAVRAIGWREICNSEEGDSAIRAHFYRAYTACLVRGIEDRSIPDHLRIGGARERLEAPE